MSDYEDRWWHDPELQKSGQTPNEYVEHWRRYREGEASEEPEFEVSSGDADYEPASGGGGYEPASGPSSDSLNCGTLLVVLGLLAGGIALYGHFQPDAPTDAPGPAPAKKTSDEAKQELKEQREREQRERDAANTRTWTSADGESSVKARFAGTIGPQVTLVKEDGTRVTLPIDKLSAEDQAWIRAKAR